MANESEATESAGTSPRPPKPGDRVQTSIGQGRVVMVIDYNEGRRDVEVELDGDPGDGNRGRIRAFPGDACLPVADSTATIDASLMGRDLRRERERERAHVLAAFVKENPDPETLPDRRFKAVTPAGTCLWFGTHGEALAALGDLVDAAHRPRHAPSPAAAPGATGHGTDARILPGVGSVRRGCREGAWLATPEGGGDPLRDEDGRIRRFETPIDGVDALLAWAARYPSPIPSPAGTTLPAPTAGGGRYEFPNGDRITWATFDGGYRGWHAHASRGGPLRGPDGAVIEFPTAGDAAVALREHGKGAKS